MVATSQWFFSIGNRYYNHNTLWIPKWQVEVFCRAAKIVVAKNTLDTVTFHGQVCITPPFNKSKKSLIIDNTIRDFFFGHEKELGYSFKRTYRCFISPG